MKRGIKEKTGMAQEEREQERETIDKNTLRYYTLNLQKLGPGATV